MRAGRFGAKFHREVNREKLSIFRRNHVGWIERSVRFQTSLISGRYADPFPRYEPLKFTIDMPPRFWELSSTHYSFPGNAYELASV